MSDFVPITTQDNMTAEQQGTFFDPVGAANRAGGMTPQRPLPSALAYPTPQSDLGNHYVKISTKKDVEKSGNMDTAEPRAFTPPSDEVCHGAPAHDVVMSEPTTAEAGQATAPEDNIMQQIAVAAHTTVAPALVFGGAVAQDPVIQAPSAHGSAVQDPSVQGPAVAADILGTHLEETPQPDKPYASVEDSVGPDTSYTSLEGSFGPDTSYGSIDDSLGPDTSFENAVEGTPGPGTPLKDSLAEASSNQNASPRPGHFRCRFDDHNPCRTGQTTMNLARKTISDHFGRNKAQTRAIRSWPLFCRKHYQRATYKIDQWQLRKCVLILEQLETIERQFPGARYTIILKKSEAARLNGFLMAMANGTPVDQARAQFAPNETNRKTFEAPLHVLGELGRYLGKDKPRTDVEIIVALVRDMLKDKETKQFPAIEFLPQLPIPRASSEATEQTGTEQAGTEQAA